MTLQNGNIVQLVEGIVGTLRNTGTIISETVSGNYLIVEVSDLFDLEAGDWVTINGTDYKIKSVDTGVPSMKLRTNQVTGGSAFTTAAPYFFHGTTQMINNEQGAEADFKHRYPAIYLFEIFRETLDLDPLNANSRTPRLSLAFLNYSSADWNSDQHEPVIDEMESLCDRFIEALDNNPFTGKLELAERFRHPNFGTFVTDKGNVRQLMNDQTSGVTLEIDVPIRRSFDGCKHFEFYVCAPGLIRDGNGNLIQTLGAGETYVDTDNLVSTFLYPAASIDIAEVTVTNALVGTYVAESLTNVSIVTYEIDTGSGYVISTLPFTLNLSDKIKVTITRAASGDSEVSIST